MFVYGRIVIGQLNLKNLKKNWHSIEFFFLQFNWIIISTTNRTLHFNASVSWCFFLYRKCFCMIQESESLVEDTSIKQNINKILCIFCGFSQSVIFVWLILWIVHNFLSSCMLDSGDKVVSKIIKKNRQIKIMKSHWRTN